MNRIKKELVKLKRENQRLRKMLNRTDVTPEMWDELDLEDELDEKPKKRAKKEKRDKEERPEKHTESAGKCPKCKTPTEEVMLGSFTYLFCADRSVCKYRKKLR